MSVGKRNLILGIVICVGVVTIGISFAYFTSGVNLTGEGSKVEGGTADLIDVSYDAGSSTINLQNAVPGATASKAFTVTVTPTESEKRTTYAIILDITNNTFEKCTDNSNGCTLNANEITYTLKDNTGTIASGDLTEATGPIELIKETKEVSTATTFNYTLELTYVNTGSNQNHNANKTLTSNLKVEFRAK